MSYGLAKCYEKDCEKIVYPITFDIIIVDNNPYYDSQFPTCDRHLKHINYKILECKMCGSSINVNFIKGIDFTKNIRCKSCCENALSVINKNKKLISQYKKDLKLDDSELARYMNFDGDYESNYSNEHDDQHDESRITINDQDTINDCEDDGVQRSANKTDADAIFDSIEKNNRRLDLVVESVMDVDINVRNMIRDVNQNKLCVDKFQDRLLNYLTYRFDKTNQHVRRRYPENYYLLKMLRILIIGIVSGIFILMQDYGYSNSLYVITLLVIMVLFD